MKVINANLITLLMSFLLFSCNHSLPVKQIRRTGIGHGNTCIMFDDSGNGVVSSLNRAPFWTTDDGGKSWKRQENSFPQKKAIAIRDSIVYFLVHHDNRVDYGLVGFNKSTREIIEFPEKILDYVCASVCGDSLRIILGDDRMLTISNDLVGHSTRHVCTGHGGCLWTCHAIGDKVISFRGTTWDAPVLWIWDGSSVSHAALPVVLEYTIYKHFTGPMINSKGEVFVGVCGKYDNAISVYRYDGVEGSFTLHASLDVDAESWYNYEPGWVAENNGSCQLAAAWHNPLVESRIYTFAATVLNRDRRIDSPLLYSLDDGETWNLEMHKESAMHTRGGHASFSNGKLFICR